MVVSLTLDSLVQIFSFFDGYMIPRLGFVCKEWQEASRDNLVWEPLCRRIWRMSRVQLARVVRRRHGQSWYRLFSQQDHLRFDGYYTMTQQNFRIGGTGFMGRPGSHVLHDTWFRYFYFTPGGMLYYCMTHKERPPKYLSDSHWYPGTYYQHLKDSRVQVKVFNGTMTLLIELSFEEPEYESNNRMVMAKLQGVGEDHDGRSCRIDFECPDPPLLFWKRRPFKAVAPAPAAPYHEEVKTEETPL